MKFKQGDLVFMRRLGDSAPGEYRGKICGCSAIFGTGIEFYIVEQFDKIPGQKQWSHVNLISSCIDLATPDELQYVWNKIYIGD